MTLHAQSVHVLFPGICGRWRQDTGVDKCWIGPSKAVLLFLGEIGSAPKMILKSSHVKISECVVQEKCLMEKNVSVCLGCAGLFLMCGYYKLLQL